MKRFLIVLSVLMAFNLPSFVLASIGSSGRSDAGSGYWQLTSTFLDQAAEVKNVEVTLSENYASYYQKHPESEDVFAASANWTSPEETYNDGDTVTLTLNLSIEQYDWHGQEDSFHSGLNYMGMHMSARFDAPDVPYGFAGNSSVALRNDDGDNLVEVSATNGTIHNSSDSITVSATFPSAYKDGHEICLYVSPSGCGNVRFNYTWHADNAPSETSTTSAETTEEEDEAERQIWLSGIVADVENEIMPRLKMKIDVYNDADLFWSNVADNYELACGSYLYSVLWDALLFGTIIFDEGDNLKKSQVKIETYWTPGSDGISSKTSHYQSGGASRGTIRLMENHSGFDDRGRYTILHEFGHHFDCMTNNGKFRAVSLDTSGNMVNHGGYMNPSTADSFMEGLATAYALFVQQYRGDKNPYIAGDFNLDTPGNYVSWKHNGKFEELAISILLNEIYQGYEDKTAYWQLLKPNRANFYKYYQAIETDLKTADRDSRSRKPSLENLQQLAHSGGLYKMPFGDGGYNFGEPFLDKKVSGSDYGNGIRSDDEIYGDLMFSTNILNMIKPDTPLRTPPENYEYGKSSDASRNRETIELIPESFLHFDNSTDDLSASLAGLIVEIKPQKGQDSKQLLTMQDNKIYLGLTSNPQKGKVIVSIPGGKTLFEGDIEELQEIRDNNYGRDIPLETVDLNEFDQDDLMTVRQASFDLDNQKYELWPIPSEGSVKSDELIKLPSRRQISQGNKQAEFKEKSIQAHVTPEYLADIEQGRLKPHPLRIISRIILIYAITLLITAVIVIVVMIRRRKKQTNTRLRNMSS